MSVLFNTVTRLLAASVMGLAAAPAFAITGIIDLSDSPNLLFGSPGFSYCDKSPGAAPSDGVIHFDSATADGYCAFGTGIPGLSASFDVLYGPGPPTGVSGIGGALYHITFTNFTLTNTSTEAFGPGDFSFRFTAGSPANFPDGVAKSLGVILAGTADDNAGDGAVNVKLRGGGGIDTGGAATLLEVVTAGPVAVGGSIGFSESLLSSTTFGIQGGSLVANLYITAPPGDGFHLPGSFDVVVLGGDYTWNPTVVPLPAGGWLLGTGIAVLAARRRRSGH